MTNEILISSLTTHTHTHACDPFIGLFSLGWFYKVPGLSTEPTDNLPSLPPAHHHYHLPVERSSSAATDFRRTISSNTLFFREESEQLAAAKEDQPTGETGATGRTLHTDRQTDRLTWESVRLFILFIDSCVCACVRARAVTPPVPPTQTCPRLGRPGSQTAAGPPRYWGSRPPPAGGTPARPTSGRPAAAAQDASRWQN